MASGLGEVRKFIDGIGTERMRLKLAYTRYQSPLEIRDWASIAHEYN